MWPSEIIQTLKQAVSPKKKAQQAPKKMRKVPVMLARKVAGSWHRYQNPIYPVAYENCFWRFPVGKKAAKVGVNDIAIHFETNEKIKLQSKRGFDAFRI